MRPPISAPRRRGEEGLQRAPTVNPRRMGRENKVYIENLDFPNSMLRQTHTDRFAAGLGLAWGGCSLEIHLERI